MFTDFNKIYSLEIDLKNLEVVYNSKAVYANIDLDTSVMLLKLTLDAQPLNIDGKIINAYIKTNKDQNVTMQRCEILEVEEGIVGLDFKNSALKAGTNVFFLEIKSANGEIINSPLISYKVVEHFDIDNGIEGENDTTILRQLITEVEVAKTSVEALKNEIAAQESRRERAEVDRKNNENTRTQAETSRIQAENSRTSKETSRQQAESSRANNESLRVQVETTRVEAEKIRASKEASRQQAEATRVQSENSRINSESLRVQAENSRTSKETSRQQVENSRVEAENSRVSKEVTRVQAESVRENKENSRVNSESLRVQAETTRVNNETSRVQAENSRTQAEIKRSQAETTRVEAEKERELSYEKIKKDNSTFKEEMNESFGNAKTDYFGKEHLNVVDRLNSDFDNVHQRINDSNYLEYSGYNIKADNTYYGYTKGLSVKGRTLQNILLDKTNISFDFATNKQMNTWGFVSYTPSQALFKPNTLYTFIVNVTKNTTPTPINSQLIWFGNVSSNDSKYFFPSGDLNKGIYRGSFDVGATVFTLKTKTSFTGEEMHSFSTQFFKSVNEGVVEYTLMILEGDYTNTHIEEIPFITGIKSTSESDVAEDGKYPVKVKSYGKNLFNGELELGGILSHNGLLQTSNAFIRCKDFTYIPVNFRNKSFKLSTNIPKFNTKEGTVICFYDYNKQYISGGNHVAMLKIPYNACYLKFRIRKDDGSIVTDEELSTILIQIEQGTLATDYEPYQESIQELLLTEPLRSLPNGICDEILEDGTEIRRVGKIVLDGSESWINCYYPPSENGTHYQFSLGVFNFPFEQWSNSEYLMCDTIPTCSSKLIWSGIGDIGIGTDRQRIFITTKIDNAQFTDLATLKQWLRKNPTTLYYCLPNPIITKHNKNINLKTYDGTTHITSDNYLQPKNSCKIPSNVQAVVSNLKEENETLNTQVSVLNLENEAIKETNVTQDELINTTMMATDEMYLMLEPLLTNMLVDGETVNPLVNMYVAMVKRGLKKIEQVPEKYREQVKELIGQ